MKRALLLLFVMVLSGCEVNVTGVTRHVIETPNCPTPIPVVNDMNELPSTFPLFCPYGVRQPDGTIVVHTFDGFGK